MQFDTSNSQSNQIYDEEHSRHFNQREQSANDAQ